MGFAGFGVYWTSALAVMGIAALAWRRPQLAGTTLLEPWSWAMISLIAIAASEVAINQWFGEPGAALASHVRYAGAVTTICPLIALLGAKRPQDLAWQFVVVSLLVVLWLPAMQGAVFYGESPLEMHAAWSGFLALLIVLGMLNTAPTRFWLAGLLAGGGQSVLLAEHLPWINLDVGSAGPTIGLALLIAAVAHWALRFPPHRSEQGIARLWLDFRDGFGAFWAMRFMERFNTSAALLEWPVRLRWRGIEIHETGASLRDLPKETDRAIQTTLTALLRRFVSSDWIAARRDGEKSSGTEGS